MTRFGLQEAYDAQRELVARNQSRCVGYKIAFSSAIAQQRFGMSEPAFGVLTASMQREAGITLHRLQYVSLQLENEIAFILGADAPAQVSSIDGLKSIVGSVAPAIEAPDFGFPDGEQVSGYDVVAQNAMAAAFILGEPRPVESVDIDSVKVVMSREGEPCDTGSAANVLGSPWQALLWLVNALLQYRYTLRKGDIVLTGAMGNMIPARPGEYFAEYKGLGQLKFQVV